MEEHWNDDLQDLFDIIDLGLRRMRAKKKITNDLYYQWCKETALSSMGKLDDNSYSRVDSKSET